MLEALWLDLRHAVRSLRRTPGFTTTAVLTLTIAMAATIAIAAVVNSVLLRPLPYADPDRLIGAWHDFPPIHLDHGGQAAITFWAYQTEAHTIQSMGIYKETAVNLAGDASRGEASAPRRVNSTSMSASMFTVLGVSAERGRVFTADEDKAGASPVVVISDALWRSQFGSDAAIIGKTLDVNGVSRQVIGVTRPEFRFPSSETALWMPLALDPARPPADAFTYNAVARLKPGFTREDAQRDFAAVLPRIPDLYPTFVPGISTRQIMDQTKPRPVITSFRSDVTGGIANTLWIIATAAGLLLLVACFNVANLTTIRFEGRRRELAVREAIGGGRMRIVRLCFCESLIVAAAAGAASLPIAGLGVQGLVTAAPDALTRVNAIHVDGAVWLTTLVIALGVAAACTIVPAWRIFASAMALRESARGATVGRAQHRVRAALVTAQIALTLLLLAASGLLVRSFQRLHAVRAGFDAQHVATFWLSLPKGRFPRDADVTRLYAALADRMSRVSGVTSVALSSRLPLVNRATNENPMYPEDAPQYETSLPPLQVFTSVGDGYFRTMRIPLIAGKDFDPMSVQRDQEAIVSSRTAAFFWHDSTGRGVIGKRFRALPSDPWYTVIGVAADAHDTSLAAPPSPTVYFPEVPHVGPGSSHLARTMVVVARTTGDPADLLGAAQRIVSELDPTLPVFEARAMTDVVRASTARLTFTIQIIAAAAIVTLLLGALGVYGTLAHIVALRRREFSIRIAIGASPRGVALGMTEQAMRLAVVGAALGIVLFAVSARFVRAFLFGVAEWDPVALGVAVMALLVSAGLASWIPARRASLVDPSEVLRSE